MAYLVFIYYLNESRVPYKLPVWCLLCQLVDHHVPGMMQLYTVMDIPSCVEYFTCICRTYPSCVSYGDNKKTHAMSLCLFENSQQDSEGESGSTALMLRAVALWAALGTSFQIQRV